MFEWRLMTSLRLASLQCLNCIVCKINAGATYLYPYIFKPCQRLFSTENPITWRIRYQSIQLNCSWRFFFVVLLKIIEKPIGRWQFSESKFLFLSFTLFEIGSNLYGFYAFVCTETLAVFFSLACSLACFMLHRTMRRWTLTLRARRVALTFLCPCFM